MKPLEFFLKFVATASILMTLACAKKDADLLNELKSENIVSRQWNFDSSVNPTMLGETAEKVYVSSGSVGKYLAGYYLLTVHVKPYEGAVKETSLEVKVYPETGQTIQMNVSSSSAAKVLYFSLDTSGGDPTLYVESDFDGISSNGDFNAYLFHSID
jgi:hypothetical protein